MARAASRPEIFPLLAASLGLAGIVTITAPAWAGCPPDPRPTGNCLQFGQSALTVDNYGHFDWRASKGQAASADDFISPSASYHLCVWDEQHLVVAADIPTQPACPGGSCWNDSGDDVQNYVDRSGENGDIRLLNFQGSDSDQTTLHARVFVNGGIILPVTGDGVIVQASRDDNGKCFEGFVPADDFKLDDKAAFVAKSQIDLPPAPTASDTTEQ
ncbi:MAG TPA: hypothetical protein VGK20_03920 [Candidatus Binatia bacterium]|jgi:hypothetical protein